MHKVLAELKNVWAGAWQNQQNDTSTQQTQISLYINSLNSLHCLHEEALGPYLPM